MNKYLSFQQYGGYKLETHYQCHDRGYLVLQSSLAL